VRVVVYMSMRSASTSVTTNYIISRSGSSGSSSIMESSAAALAVPLPLVVLFTVVIL